MLKNKNLLVKTKKASNKGFWIFLVLILVVMGMSFLRNARKVRRIEETIKKEEERVEELKKKKQELEKKIEEIRSVDYIEKQLRDKLGLAKEGEVVIILPDDETLKSLSPKIEEEEETLPDPNWKKWINLFFR